MRRGAKEPSPQQTVRRVPSTVNRLQTVQISVQWRHACAGGDGEGEASAALVSLEPAPALLLLTLAAADPVCWSGTAMTDAAVEPQQQLLLNDEINAQ